MADSLMIANVIELMMGDDGPVYSTLPNLENTIFALNDQQDTYSLGAPQPTVDILASLITDGERPQGRRASNRTLSIPVAIISDTRDNLALARETLFALVDQERWTLSYTRDSSGTGPLILDCWRAEPTTIAYIPTEEQQFVSEVVLNFEALPYGRSDIPNTITFASPAGGTTPPPPAIILDNFTIQAPGQIAPWTQTLGLYGDGAQSTVPSGELATAVYTSMLLGGLDFTTGGTGLNNVINFWAGFASQKYYSKWANHSSEMTFTVSLYDNTGKTVSASTHKKVSQNSNLASPAWTNVSIRMPTSNTRFNYSNVTGYTISAYNYTSKGQTYLKDSVMTLDSMFAVSPSSSVTAVTRGAVYKLNGVEGSVHAPVSFAITQQPSTSILSNTFTGTGPTVFQAPAGVDALAVSAIGPGGPGAATTAAAGMGGGGGAEYAMKSLVPVTPGTVYPVWSPQAQAYLPAGSSAYSGAWTGAGNYFSNNPGTGFNQPFTAAIPVGASVFVQVAIPVSATITVSDSVGGSYTQIAGSSASDGTYMAVFARFNISAALSTSNTYTVTTSVQTASIGCYVNYTTGILSSLPAGISSGTGTAVDVESYQSFMNANATFTNHQDSNWAAGYISGTGAVTNFSAAWQAGTTGDPANGYMTIASSLAGSQPALVSQVPMTVQGSAKYLPKAFLKLATQTDMKANLVVQWYDATGTFISNSTVQVTLTAGTWQWSNDLSGGSAAITAPANASSAYVAAQVNTAVAGAALNIGALGLAQNSNEVGAYVAIVANQSNVLSAASVPGWTNLRNANNGAGGMAFSTYYRNAHGSGGQMFSYQGLNGSSVPWAALIFKISNSAGYAQFVGDNGVRVLAHGGIAALGATGALPGTGSDADIHNDGGSGANNVSATVGGGGGGSGGSGAAGSWVDDTDGTMTWSAASSPPWLISQGVVSNPHLTTQTGNSNTYGGLITNSEMNGSDLLLAVTVNKTSGSPAQHLSDSNGNTWAWIQNFALANGYQASVFWAHSTNQSDGTLSSLVSGDTVYLNSSSDDNQTAYIFVYAMRGVTAQAGTTATSSSKTISYQASSSRSYYGSDATGTPNGTRSSNGTIYQGGETASGGTFNGTQKSIIMFPKSTIQSDFDGWTFDRVTLWLTNEGSWYDSGCTVELQDYNSSSLPGSYNGSSNAVVRNWSLTTPQGGRPGWNLDESSVGPNFVSGSQYGFVIGPGSGGYNLSYYGHFNGTPNNANGPVLTIAGHISVPGTGLGDVTFEQNPSGTSFSVTDSGFSGSNIAHVVTTMSQDAILNAMSPAQNPVVDSENFSAVAGDGFTGMTILQEFWKDADSTTSTTFSFTRPTTGDVAISATSWKMDTVGWSSATGAASYHNGTHHYTSAGGKKLKISFTGQHIQVMGLKGTNQGIMLVSLDGGVYQKVDNYASTTQYQTVLYDTGVLTNTSHTVTILTTGRQNPSSSGSWIDIDGYMVLTAGQGLSASGQTGGAAITGGGSGGNGGSSAGGLSGGTPGGGGGGAGGAHAGGVGGPAQVQVSYTSGLPAFKTLVLHRPYIYGSRTLNPYVACASQAVPTSDIVQGIYSGVPAQFNGTYSIVIAASAFNSPTASRTITVTVTEYEDDPAGVLPAATSTQSTARIITPSTDAPNNLVTIGELTLPNKELPPDNNMAVYKVSVNSTNSSDTIQDVMFLDTMGQTVIINEATGYSQYFIDEPTPDRDIGRIMGSQFDRQYAISCMDYAFPSGGPLTAEPGDNILFAYCVEGAPALVATYFPRYYIDRTVS